MIHQGFLACILWEQSDDDDDERQVNNDGIHGPMPLHDDRPQPKRASALASWPTKGGSGSKDLAPSAGPGPTGPLVPDTSGGAGGGRPSVGGGGQSDGISGSARSSGEAGADSIQGAPSAAVARDPKVPNVFVHALDGSEIAFKAAHMNGKLYRNYRLKCPLHQDCFKVKGETIKLMKMLGPIGPPAFLHAWIPEEPRDDRPHNLCNPSDDAVKAYAAAHGDALKEVMERAQTASAMQG